MVRKLKLHENMELKLENLPKELADKIMKRVRENKKYMELIERKNKYLRNGNYVMAMNTTKAIMMIENECIRLCTKAHNDELRKVNDLIADMNEQDKGDITTLGNALVFIADILESLSLDTNELLKKYHPNFRIEMFDKLTELAIEARKHIRMLDDYKDDKYYTNLYADTADKMRELIVNKSRSFTNKTKAHYEKEANKAVKRNAKVA